LVRILFYRKLDGSRFFQPHAKHFNLQIRLQRVRA